MAKSTLGKRIFLSILSLFVVFAVLFIVFQQYREREYKIETLNLRLQNTNALIVEALNYMESVGDREIDKYIETHCLPAMRVTITDTEGNVKYDNARKDYLNIENHLDRKEIKNAIRYGSGYDISRFSDTVEGDFFYSATYFRDKGIVVRSALPYNNDLTNSLKADQHYIWFALITMAVLITLLYRFIIRLDTNITKLRIFAGRADHNESLETEDLAQFPDDELGEISESIIKIYKRLQKTKEEQNVLKRQLTQNIAHELKTPVSSIQGYLETITANPDMSEEIKAQFLDRCFAQSQRLASLLQDMSILNRLDDGTEMMQFENIDIVQIVKQIKRETTLQLYEHNMEFDDRLPEKIEIEGSQSMVYSIFRNLTDNALAYSGDGTIITLSAEETPEGQWHFSFRDNGIGVESKHLERLFERFYRVDKGRSRKMGGTGLGLAIVKNAVILHGGTISASHNDGGGLRFDFTLNKTKQQTYK